MGFFNNLFGSKKEKAVSAENIVLLNISDIEDWIKNNCSDIDINYFSKKFGDVLSDIEDNAKLLLEIKFERDTDARLKQKVMSNIETYVKYINLFVKKINLDLLKDDISLAIKTYEEEINSFNLQTSKNFMYLSALFKNEALSVANCFKDFIKLLAEVKKSVFDKGSVVGLGIYNKLDTLKKFYSTRENFLKELSEKQAELKLVEEDLIKTKNSRDLFTKSKEYLNIINSDKRKAGLEEQASVVRTEVFSIISVLDSPFRRLIRVMPNIDIRELGLDRVLDENNKKIFEYCKELKENLRLLDIKEDKKEKIVLNIDKVLDGTLEALISKYFNMVEEIKSIDTSMIDSQISKTFIDINYKLNSLEYRKNKLISEISKISIRNDEFILSYDKIVQDLEDVLYSASNLRVKIKT